MARRETGKNHVLVKKENTTLIKRVLYRSAPISRAEIADLLNLTPPTITNITGELIRDGFVMELPEDYESGTVRRVGRQPVQIDLVRDARYALGISLGRDVTNVTLLNLRGEAVFQKTLPLMEGSYEEMLERTAAIIADVRKAWPAETERLLGIGIAVPALVDAHSGIILRADTERASWCGRSLAQDLEEQTGLPVRVENNVRARSFSLSLFYPEVIKTQETYALCFVSWGIACPMIFENQTVRGEDGTAGEIGHMIMNADAKAMTSGSTTLESYSSLKAIISRCISRMEEGGADVLRALCRDEIPTVEQILEAQREGDRDVIAILEEAMRVLGIALANLIDFMNPERIILSGPLFVNRINAEHAEQAMRSYSYSLSSRTTDFEVVDFGEFGGAIGAAAACIDKYFVRM